ncbi:MAG: prepilin-type N-terminal cleavage/methylation domain-containing protein [Desulfobacteraceae bacterium]|nr:prepilin-type N-terminal cleavage/methylation domain-containing protein [Desulfobacteraceae bacterium]
MMKSLKTANGFSLMELMIAMALFSIIIAAIIGSRTRQQEQHITQTQAVEMQQNVRAVMFMMKKAIRMAGFNPYTTDYTNNGINTADSTTLTFSYVDTVTELLSTDTYAFEDDDGDGNIDDITLNAVVLAENISNLTFTYFDGTSPVPNAIAAPVATPADIRSIQISITAIVDQDELAWATNNNTRTLTSTVFLRNMGL